MRPESCSRPYRWRRLRRRRRSWAWIRRCWCRPVRSSSGSCRIRDADIAASYTIYIPRWTEPKRVPKRLLDWWRRIVDFIADHEAGHVRIGRDYIKRLNDRLVGKPCDDLNSIISGWARQHAAAQEAYDMREYSKPWPQPASGY